MQSPLWQVVVKNSQKFVNKIGSKKYLVSGINITDVTSYQKELEKSHKKFVLKKASLLNATKKFYCQREVRKLQNEDQLFNTIQRTMKTLWQSFNQKGASRRTPQLAKQNRLMKRQLKKTHPVSIYQVEQYFSSR